MSRSVPAKASYTFANGVTVALERVGPLFEMPIQQANPPPPPPLAPGAFGQLEPNPADPDYARVLADHEKRLGLIRLDLLLDLGVSDDIVVDILAVSRVREIYKRGGIELAMSDKMVYLKHVCIGSQAEIEALVDAIRNQDTKEEAIAAATAMFPDHGDGTAIPGGAQNITEVEVAV